MNITQKLVATVKRHNKEGLHPQKWHDFRKLPEVRAINAAIDFLESDMENDKSPKSVVTLAKQFLEEHRDVL